MSGFRKLPYEAFENRRGALRRALCAAAHRGVWLAFDGTHLALRNGRDRNALRFVLNRRTPVSESRSLSDDLPVFRGTAGATPGARRSCSLDRRLLLNERA